MITKFHRRVVRILIYDEYLFEFYFGNDLEFVAATGYKKRSSYETLKMIVFVLRFMLKYFTPNIIEECNRNLP